MSLPAAPLVATANNPQGVGHPSTVTQNLTVANTVVGGGDPTVSIYQKDLTTPGACAVLNIGGGAGVDGPTGGANYTLFKCCGPSAGGVSQDHLQLFRYGPVGAISQLSEVLEIAPKMVADTSPAVNLTTLFSDLQVDGTIAAGNNTLKPLPAPILVPYILGGAGGAAVIAQASAGAGSLRCAMICRSATNPLLPWATMVDPAGIPYTNCKAVRVTVVGTALTAQQIAGTAPIPYSAYAHAVGVSNSAATEVESDFWVSIVDNLLVGGGLTAQDFNLLPLPLNAGPCYAQITSNSTGQATLAVPQGFPPGISTLYPSTDSTYLANAPTLSAVVSVAGSPNGIGLALGGFRQGAASQPGDTQFTYGTASTNVYFLLQPIA